MNALILSEDKQKLNALLESVIFLEESMQRAIPSGLFLFNISFLLPGMIKHYCRHFICYMACRIFQHTALQMPE